MVIWLKENIMTLLLILGAGVGTYTVGIGRVQVLEVKVNAQKERSVITDKVIQNNTVALNNISVLFARIEGKLDTFEFRLCALEEELGKHLEVN